MNKLEMIKEIIQIKSSEDKDSFDLNLIHIDHLRTTYSSIGLNVVLYPYSQSMDADSFSMLPYEEYIHDVNMGTKSIYRKTTEIGDNILGILLSLLILIVFAFLKPEEIISIESIVSIFGAYVIGKELWNDIDQGLSNLTRSWKLSWVNNAYPYAKEYFGTIQKFTQLARTKRYQKPSIFPELIDFIQHSNSKTLEIHITKSNLTNIKNDSALIMSIKFNKNTIRELNKKGFMLGFKVVLNKQVLFLNRNIELFQAIDNGKFGCIDDNDNWIKNAALLRKTFNIGKLKLYWATRTLSKYKLIS